jgi:hypothetical protein
MLVVSPERSRKQPRASHIVGDEDGSRISVAYLIGSKKAQSQKHTVTATGTRSPESHERRKAKKREGQQCNNKVANPSNFFLSFLSCLLLSPLAVFVATLPRKCQCAQHRLIPFGFDIQYSIFKFDELLIFDSQFSVLSLVDG